MQKQLPMKDVIPIPDLAQISKLQLMRTTLVKFIDWKNFEEVVQGCFVRVLLEMKTEDHTKNEQLDSYYVAVVKGAKKGPAYTGFSWEGITTEWHIVIELPPCFKSTPNGDVVQLNSISNSPFKQKEYQEWVQMTKQSEGSFISLAQIELRYQLLQEHKQQANIANSPPKRRRNQEPEDPQKVALREQYTQQQRRVIEEEVRGNHLLLPSVEHIHTMKVSQLQEVEREVLDLISLIRVEINERTKCRLCKKQCSTVICYPCKHQVLCRMCMDIVKTCPAPNCGARVEDKFEAFTS